MIVDALEITIIVSMMALIVYPTSLLVLDSWQERRKRRVRLNQSERFR
jgi:hypothetical protein